MVQSADIKDKEQAVDNEPDVHVERTVQAAAASGPLLPVMEQFYTLQGEGYHQGRAAYFIRLGGCDVGCVWCDVKESWDADKFEKIPVDNLRLNVKATP